VTQGYEWPVPAGFSQRPEWTGRGFTCEGRPLGVLQYGDNQSAWDEGLTNFHEETAGSDHYIDRASRSHAVAELKRRVARPDARVLEVGSSSGFLLPLIREALPGSLVIGSDSFGESMHRLAAVRPDFPYLQFDLTACPLPPAGLDAVVLLNVLEHIEDDRKALAEVFRILKPGGVAVIEVPAGPGIYDIYDELLRHFRRYRMGGLKASARSCGFKILDSSHLGFFLYPPFWLVKKLNQRKLKASGAEKKAEVGRQIESGQGHALMDALMKFELALGRLVSYPFGIRCLLTLQRPE
jgi:SAM-dependent methyltransferase